MPQDLTDDKSTLIQVMAWCRQATSHYMNQCWSRMPFGIISPNELSLNMLNCFRDYKRFIHVLNLISDLAWPKWVKLTLEQQHVVCPTQPIPCLLMFWGLLEPGHQQAWSWPPKPVYSISSIWRVNSLSPGWCGCDFKCVNFKSIMGIDFLSIQVNMEWILIFVIVNNWW